VSKSAREGLLPAGEAVLEQAGAITGAVDHGLVDLCRRGDPEAFARLVALHEGMVYGLAVRLLGDPEEARDLAQEVFLQVYRTLGRFEGRSSLRTWIYTIVVNQSRNRRRFWRRRFRDRSVPLDDLSGRDAARLTDPGSGPETSVAQGENGKRVHAALARLSFDHRAILLLREVEGLSCEEVSRALGIAEGTVKSRLARAREAFRAALVAVSGEAGTW
jgi:RNA polymerase sigma factor (sigma-70 family)